MTTKFSITLFQLTMAGCVVFAFGIAGCVYTALNGRPLAAALFVAGPAFMAMSQLFLIAQGVNIPRD